MTDELILQRRRAAEDTRAYLAGKLSWEQFIDMFSYSEDDLIAHLVDLIEHEPKRGGFLGVNEKQWAQYQSQLSSAIAALES
ncbi:MAG TPA: hypothetical protein VJV03_02415 [Pyrinomonadaceae bacterium]|nr:hypothetical protein [Pyrinomonadaceae bacterium]